MAAEELTAISTLDGRDARAVNELGPIVSEFGLMKRRALVETEWLRTLAGGALPDVNRLDDVALDNLRAIGSDFTISDAAQVKTIERETNHDVKAVEVWLRNRLRNDPAYVNHLELIHFGLTSEDVNNVAYGMMYRDARDKVLLPSIDNVIDDLHQKATNWADTPMLAHTHGQPASPTTVGKEFRVFAERLILSADRLGKVAITTKFSGATGNYNAMQIAYPEVNWPLVTTQFLESLDFEPHPATTQIEPHDWVAAFSNELGLSNTIMTDLSWDMWQYISLKYFRQQVKAGEVGSSTMPHKVNPIDFEKAASNFGSANAVLGSMAARLPISRMQRDLSDSSTQRTVGERLATRWLAIKHSSGVSAKSV